MLDLLLIKDEDLKKIPKEKILTIRQKGYSVINYRYFNESFFRVIQVERKPLKVVFSKSDIYNAYDLKDINYRISKL